MKVGNLNVLWSEDKKGKRYIIIVNPVGDVYCFYDIKKLGGFLIKRKISLKHRLKIMKFTGGVFRIK